MKRLRIFLLVVALIFVLAGCTDKDLDPIFFTLATERELVEDKGLEENITIWKIVKFGARYYLAADKLYTRAPSDTKWVEVPPPVSGARCETLEVYGAFLYAGFFSLSGTDYGLYRTNVDPPTQSDWDNTLFDPEVVGKPIGMIKAIGTDLYVTVATSVSPYEYYLYESTDGTTFTGLLFETESITTSPPTDIVEYPGVPTEWWVIAGSNLYADTDGTLDDLSQKSGEVDHPSITAGKVYGGLLYSAAKGDVVYLSAKDGKLWTYDGTLPWVSSAQIKADDNPVRFTHFVELEPTSTDIFVGSQGSGYYILDAGSISSVTRFPDYDISVMRNGSINRFLLDTAPDPDILFACTAGTGLWRADYVGSEWDWVQEASK